jgi:hypothetical protein
LGTPNRNDGVSDIEFHIFHRNGHYPPFMFGVLKLCHFFLACALKMRKRRSILQADLAIETAGLFDEQHNAS